MPKAKEIKIEWVHGTSEAIGGQVYFVNAEMNDCYCITVYGAPDEKVLKSKAWIKSYLPAHIEEFLLKHPGWKQADKETYDIAYSQRFIH